MNILGSQVYPMVQAFFPNNDAVFQEDDSPHTQECSVSVWGVWRCTSTSSVASTDAKLKYCRTTVGSYTEQSEKQISSIIAQAASNSCTVFSTRDYSELTRVSSKKDTSCVRGKWWPNSILIKKYVSYGLSSPLYLCKLDWNDIYCLTRLHVSALFMAIFRLINEKLSKQLYSTCGYCIQWGVERWSGYEISHVCGGWCGYMGFGVFAILG